AGESPPLLTGRLVAPLLPPRRVAGIQSGNKSRHSKTLRGGWLLARTFWVLSRNQSTRTRRGERVYAFAVSATVPTATTYLGPHIVGRRRLQLMKSVPAPMTRFDLLQFDPLFVGKMGG